MLLSHAVVLLALAADGGVSFFDSAPRETGCAEYQVTYAGKCMAKKRFLVLIGTIAGWKESCESGDKTGCAPLGEAYRDGTLVPKSPQFAAKLWQRGCDAKEPMACRLLGEALQKTDPLKGTALLAQSCELGEPLACTALGFAVLEGRGVKADRKKARAIFGQGCNLGALPSCDAAKTIDAGGCTPLEGGNVECSLSPMDAGRSSP